MGATYGDIDLYNKYAELTQCDAIFATGNIGLFYDTDCRGDVYPISNFQEYLDGNKEFIKPIIAVPGSAENHLLLQDIIDGKIFIDNFTLLGQGEKYKHYKSENDGVGITGLGKVYSPKSYSSNHPKKHHMNYEDVMRVRQNFETNVLLMHELPGPYKKKEIEFTSDMLTLINETLAFFCFVGHYEKWFSFDYSKTNGGKMVICSLPRAIDGYAILDTKRWSLEGVNLISEGEDECKQ